MDCYDSFELLTKLREAEQRCTELEIEDAALRHDGMAGVVADVKQFHERFQPDPDGGKVRKPEGWQPPDIEGAVFGDE